MVKLEHELILDEAIAKIKPRLMSCAIDLASLDVS